MSFWRTFSSVTFAVLCIAIDASAQNQSDLIDTKPNIILVMTDDQGFGQIGKHGHPWIKTPNLDSLYDQSLRFTNFYVSPTCSPTRSALMTGRYPFRNGVTHTILERERLTLEATTIAQALKSAGYTTGIFGKWHLGDEEPYQPHKRGFDEAFIHGAGGIGQAYNCSCADAPGNKYFDPIVRHNGVFKKTKGFCTDVFFTGALGWIKKQKENDQPFFAYITTNAPHGPFIAPEAAKKRFEDWSFAEKHAGFYGMIENIDTNMGRLNNYLEKWQLEKDTLVIFLSDNGTTAAGAGQGALGKTNDGKPVQSYNAGMRGFKGSIFEGGTRVPSFWRWPGKLQAGREINTIAAHIDVMPTILEIAGVKDTDRFGFDGVSLIPLLDSNESEWPDRFLFFHRGRWPKDSDHQDFKHRFCAVRNQKYRLCNHSMLYDIENDPGETNDLAKEYPQMVADMRAAYDQWWDGIQPYLVNDDVPLSKTKPFHQLYEKQMKNGGITEWVAPNLE